MNNNSENKYMRNKVCEDSCDSKVVENVFLTFKFNFISVIIYQLQTPGGLLSRRFDF